MRDMFNNTYEAFGHRSDKELKHLVWLFRLLSNKWISSVGIMIMKSFGHLRLSVVQRLQRWLFKPFYAGTTLQESEPTVAQLSNYDVFSYLNYAIEDSWDEKEFDKNSQIVQKLLLHAASAKNVPFSVCKATSFGHKHLFQKINAQQPLTDDEKHTLERIVNRFRECCKVAKAHDVGLLIDAEEYNMQFAVDQIVMDLMKEFNTSKAVVYNTIQLYLVDGNDRLQQMHSRATTESFHLGLKLVRGAYMQKERKRAQKRGLPSPICETKSDTDANFNQAVAYCLDHLSNISILLGSHNEYSMILATEIMKKNKIKSWDERVWFSQLLGMSDHITFILAKKGYNVVKFVPFGPLEKLVPYLTRRAEENTAITGQTSRELALLQKEIKRRSTLAKAL